ncbi:hypothetical protein [Erwinia tracheiphila]|uniref:hypothetical protein n=1 Tax=Erwinia tracheiphila TaxID=65700 RepID=UPI00128B8C8A|nr:hypothetical protein [Erwinia tracheiphila]
MDVVTNLFRFCFIVFGLNADDRGCFSSLLRWATYVKANFCSQIKTLPDKHSCRRALIWSDNLPVMDSERILRPFLAPVDVFSAAPQKISMLFLMTD